jgi:hypothetical protein
MNKMSPEKARQLRDGGSRARPAPFAPQAGTRKHRELRFNHQHPGDIEQARKLLSGLERMEVDAGASHASLSIWYDISDYTLEGLEAALRKQGFHLDESLLTKFMRTFVYFCEETQLRNMRVPQRLIKKSNEIYSKAWDHHPHGDHDDTPQELRHGE